MSRPDNRTPDIKLTPDALHQLRQIFKYTRVISSLVRGFDDSTLGEVLGGNSTTKNDPALENALIYCLKAIGTHVDKALQILRIAPESAPLFLRNLHYLRNSLIHHCPSVQLPSPGRLLLAKVATKIGHVYKYFSLICDKENTRVDLKGERYKVFLDVYELATGLRDRAYSREKLKALSDNDFIHVVNYALAGVRVLTVGTAVNSGSFEAMKQDPSQYKRFYALQNLCELVATIMTPNPEYAVLSSGAIERLRAMDDRFEIVMRALGDSRNDAIHRTGIVSSRDLAVHIRGLLDLSPVFSGFLEAATTSSESATTSSNTATTTASMSSSPANTTDVAITNSAAQTTSARSYASISPEANPSGAGRGGLVLHGEVVDDDEHSDTATSKVTC